MSSAADSSAKLIRDEEYFSYVGNTMAAFVMQSLGFEVAALNTVQFSMNPVPPGAITITDQELR